MQHRITAEGPLHDEKGRLTETGYATSLIRTYDRTRIAANRLRLKEWDYYCICSDRFALALTIADNGYMMMDSISLLDFVRNTQQTKSVMGIPPFAKRDLPLTSRTGDILVRGKEYEMAFENNGTRRRLHGWMDRFPNAAHGQKITFDITLSDEPKDSMVIVTPYRESPKAFYYNQKINCMRADGTIRCGEQEYLCRPSETFAVLDWGRGVWTYDNTWFWGSASGLADGIPFGFNIGYGFGDTSAASENMVFYNGTAHKLNSVTFEIPSKDGKDDFLSPWRFSSDDGRFEMAFRPVMDRSAKIDLLVLCSDQHQVFGRFSGSVILDNGEKIEIRDLMGFAEKVRNKW